MSVNRAVTATGDSITTVTSQIHPLAYMKAIATLVGSIATGLLGVYAADSTVGQVLTVIAIIATAIVTWVVPNAPVVPDDVIVGEEADDGMTYEEAGGLPFPADYDESALYGDGAERGETVYGDPDRA